MLIDGMHSNLASTPQHTLHDGRWDSDQACNKCESWRRLAISCGISSSIMREGLPTKATRTLPEQFIFSTFFHQAHTNSEAFALWYNT
jgi:hypothetical protein